MDVTQYACQETVELQVYPLHLHLGYGKSLKIQGSKEMEWPYTDSYQSPVLEGYVPSESYLGTVFTFVLLRGLFCLRI